MDPEYHLVSVAIVTLFYSIPKYYKNLLSVNLLAFHKKFPKPEVPPNLFT